MRGEEGEDGGVRGEGWVSELGDDDLRLLVALGSEPVAEPAPRTR